MGHDFRNPPPLHVLIVRPWIPLLRGFWALVFSELTLFMPDMTLKALSILFGLYALIDGAFAFLLAVRTPASGQNWWLGSIGISGIVAGLFALLWQGPSEHALLYFIALWAVAVGVGEIAGAVALRKAITREWLLTLGGSVATVFGLVLMFRSGEDPLALIWLIGGFALVWGILKVAAAYHLRRHIVGSAQRSS